MGENKNYGWKQWGLFSLPPGGTYYTEDVPPSPPALSSAFMTWYIVSEGNILETTDQSSSFTVAYWNSIKCKNINLFYRKLADPPSVARFNLEEGKGFPGKMNQNGIT